MEVQNCQLLGHSIQLSRELLTTYLVVSAVEFEELGAAGVDLVVEFDEAMSSQMVRADVNVEHGEMLADSYSNLVHHIWSQIVVVHHKLLHSWVVSK